MREIPEVRINKGPGAGLCIPIMACTGKMTIPCQNKPVLLCLICRRADCYDCPVPGHLVSGGPLDHRPQAKQQTILLEES